jgi:hypothetical protein
VLKWLSAVMLILAAVLTLRWSIGRFDRLGRRRAFPVISVALSLVIGIGAAVPVGLHARLERRLTGAASAVAGAKVSVHCQTVGEASVDLGPELGYVKFGADGVPEHHTLIKWKPCRELAGWLGSDRRDPSRGEMVAVHVLTHESMHMAGTTDEAVTECRAMQRDALMARTLGADPAAARALAERYWREFYPSMPENYRTSGCVASGSLDEHLPDPPWPEAGPEAGA